MYSWQPIGTTGDWRLRGTWSSFATSLIPWLPAGYRRARRPGQPRFLAHRAPARSCPPYSHRDEDLARARSLREALRAFLLTNASFPLPAEAAEDFDAAVGSVRLRTRAAEAGRVELRPAEAGGLEHAIGRLVAIVFVAQQDGTWPRLKACAECHWALYDHTKNHSAAWCGSQCGARVRARRHRKRRLKDSA
jgi:predicted RNA-binding Zn ribbon-like protein